VEIRLIKVKWLVIEITSTKNKHSRAFKKQELLSNSIMAFY